jgi:cardiolipin synthase
MLEFWPYLLAAADVAVAAVASAHAMLRKRDVRAAIGWVGLIWLAPIVGSCLYVVFGINRIHRRARVLRERSPGASPPAPLSEPPPESVAPSVELEGSHLASLARLVGSMVRAPLLAGNRILPLFDGDQAYPVLLEAIEGAQRSVSLCSYIFDNDRIGARFVDALRRARERGVEVRVLLDDVGVRYSWPRITRALKRSRIPAATFLPTFAPWLLRFTNLRNHRKILVVDGAVGFTGGMNIREGHCIGLAPRHPVQDIHFRIEGPVVAHLQAAFANDWAFATEEVLEGDAWFPALDSAGAVLARGIPDGPDEDHDKVRMAILGAIACARSSLRVVTPYFLPDAPLIAALNVAALRGVDVKILLPERCNLALVRWATMAQLWQVLEGGCRVYLSPPPFDHTKLLIVDGAWTLLGSVNWDSRSLRLNFEFNVECYDGALAGSLTEIVESRIARSREATLRDVDGRSLPVRLRDGVARLFSPYL